MTGCPRVPRPSATLTGRYCYLPDPVRLACLIHATSVRSEPESNSQKKTSLRLARALRLAGRRPRREPSPSPLFSLSLVSRVPSGGSLGAPSETRSSSTISSQGSTSAPRRAVARWVANEDIVYQIPRGRARGKGHFSRKSCRRPVHGKDNASERSPSWLLTPRRRGFFIPTADNPQMRELQQPETENGDGLSTGLRAG